jgi:hypothetical protein
MLPLFPPATYRFSKPAYRIPGASLRAVAVLNTCGENAASKAMYVGPDRLSTFPLLDATSTCRRPDRYPPGDSGSATVSPLGPRLTLTHRRLPMDVSFRAQWGAGGTITCREPAEVDEGLRGRLRDGSEVVLAGAVESGVGHVLDEGVASR